jgi:phage-related protein
MPQVVSSITSGISKAVSSVTQIGKNIVQGLWQGIQSMGQWIQDKIGSLFKSVVDGAKSVLGIHSPSTVFAGIGENMGLGLGSGFTDAMAGVEQDITNAIPTNFDLDVNADYPTKTANPLGSVAKRIIEHTGTIRIEGVNDEGIMTKVVDFLVGELRQEVLA